MCSLVTPQVWERVITASVLLWFSFENVWEKFSVMITTLQNIQLKIFLVAWVTSY